MSRRASQVLEHGASEAGKVQQADRLTAGGVGGWDGCGGWSLLQPPAACNIVGPVRQLPSNPTAGSSLNPQPKMPTVQFGECLDQRDNSAWAPEQVTAALTGWR